MIQSISAFRRAVLAPFDMVKNLYHAIEENRASAKRLMRAIDSCVSVGTVGKVAEVAQGVNRDAGTDRK